MIRGLMAMLLKTSPQRLRAVLAAKNGTAGIGPIAAGDLPADSRAPRAAHTLALRESK